MIDIHCHILPEIDDGAPNMEVALAMARQAVEDGITHIVATPHFRPPYELHPQLALRAQRLEELRAALKEAGIPLELLAGAEVQARDNTFKELLKQHPQLLVPNTERDGAAPAVLLELPMEMPVDWAQELFFLAQLHHFRMVLAHPERQPNFLSQLSELQSLASQGMMLQFNATSIHRGFLFGRRLNRAIFTLMAEAPEQVFLATDAHETEHRPCCLTEVKDIVVKAVGEAAWRLMTEENARRLLGL